MDTKEDEKQILEDKTDEVKGVPFYLLQLRFTKVTKNSIRLKWTKVKGANKYIVYGAPCGSKYKKLKTLSKTTYTQKKLKKGKYYKYFVAAVSEKDGTQTTIAKSVTVHVATKGGKIGNYKSVKLKNIKKHKLTLKKKKSFTIKAKAVPASKKLKVRQHRKLSFESNNPKIATVSKKGKIKAKKRGKCTIYVYSQSGTFAKIKVTVK